MAQDAAQHAADHRAADVGPVPHFLLLDPAALLLVAHHGAHRDHLRLIQRLLAAAVVGGLRLGAVAVAANLGALVHAPRRADPVVEAHRAQRRVAARLQHAAAAAIVRVLADLPALAAHLDRGRAVVEADLLEETHLRVDAAGAAAELLVLVEGDVGHRLAGQDAGGGRDGRLHRAGAARLHDDPHRVDAMPPLWSSGAPGSVGPRWPGL